MFYDKYFKHKDNFTKTNYNKNLYKLCNYSIKYNLQNNYVSNNLLIYKYHLNQLN